jgi:hypothetical protein
MSTIVLRQTKGSALTFAEGDANFSNLNADKLEDITNESIGDLSDVDLTGNSDNYILVYNSSSGNFEVEAQPSAGISNVVEDTTPQLGGDLDCQGNDISNPVLKDYAETIYSLGSTDSPTITISNGNVQSVSITSGLSLPAFSDAATGQSVTLLVTGSGTASGTGAYKFAGGNTTLTSYSVVSVFYDGTTYWASIATDFQ